MRRTVVCLILLLAVAVPAGAGSKTQKHITLYGTNNPLVDPDNLRGAIASVKNNGTLTLVGTFQLDGSFVFIDRGHITIEGIAIDNDDDGAVNEDWADGVDNDSDGATDEDDWDSELRGILDINGEPVDDLQPPDFAFFNRGLTLWGQTKDVDKVTIRNIKFFGFNRAIEFGANTLFQDGIRCDDIVDTGGTVKHGVIEGNWFDNNERGMQIFGAAKDIAIRDNLFTNTVRAWALPLVSGGVFCFDADGNNSSYDVGTPTGTQVIGNRFDGGTHGAIGVFGATRTLTSGNTVTNFTNGMNVGGGDNDVQGNQVFDVLDYGILITGADSRVVGNQVSNIGNYGILLFSDGEGTLIANNTIADVTFGLLFSQAVGFTAMSNTITNASAWDYFLNETSSNNVVRLLAGQTVEDLGTDNDIQ